VSAAEPTNYFKVYDPETESTAVWTFNDRDAAATARAYEAARLHCERLDFESPLDSGFPRRVVSWRRVGTSGPWSGFSSVLEGWS